MPPSPKEATQRWLELTREAARNFTVGVGMIAAIRDAYIAGTLTVEEFEAEVGKLLAESGR